MNQRTDVPLILIVDEDPSTLRVTQTLLRLHGYDSAVATSPDDAVAAYANALPDAVLLEWSFRSGFARGLATRLRERAFRHKRSLVIIVFSVLEEPDGFRDHEIVDDYFVKPTHISEIAHRIRTLLHARRNREDMRPCRVERAN